MANDEKKSPRISLAQATLAMIAAFLGPALQDEARMLSMLRPRHYHPTSRHGGAVAHQRWKRRRASGLHR